MSLWWLNAVLAGLLVCGGCVALGCWVQACAGGVASWVSMASHLFRLLI